MITRRSFLKSSAAALPVLVMHNSSSWAAEHIPLGVQLYTLRKMAAKDLPGALRQIRAIGYDEIETYGDSYTYPADKLRGMIRDAGLRAPSGHFDYDSLPGKLDYAKQLGLKWAVCPMLPPAMWNLDGFHTAAKLADVPNLAAGLTVERRCIQNDDGVVARVDGIDRPPIFQ